MSQTVIDPATNKKVKKNLLVVFFITVIMLFAGLSSAYLVYRGSTFWVHIHLPDGFTYSTITILLSSLALIGSVYAVKKGNHGLLKASLGAALLGAILFGVFQFKGFSQLIDSGNKVVGPIVTNSGRYGNIFTMTYEGKSISFENDVYFWKGQEMPEDLHQEMRDLGHALMAKAKNGVNEFDIPDYGTGFMIYYETDPLTLSGGSFYLNGNLLNRRELREIYEFGDNLANDRGDFIMDGKYGEDFTILYGGKPLTYDNRKFYLEGKELSPKLQNDLNGAMNTSSSFIYVFTGMHLLHWIGGVIALLVVFIRGLQNKYTTANYLGITLASNYWHFLGILWLYLYAFLIFIH